MREILFRGKRKDNGEWVYGFYVCLGETLHYILTGKLDITKGFPMFEKYEVDPETVGQYTGLTDKNGQRIFEGDILKAAEENRKPFIYKVVFVNGVFGLVVKNGGFDCSLVLWAKECVEIIGNIHDNPELMRGAKDHA